MLTRLEELTNIHGVSGDEGRVRKYIRGALAKSGAELYTDAMGNLWAHKPGKGPRVAVLAHMDEVGFIIKGIRDDGLLAYDQCGMDARIAVSKRVAVGKNLVPGVIGAKAIHLQSEDEFARAMKHSELYIDIGAKDKKDAETKVSVGDYACFTTRFERFGDSLMRAKAFDDRAGCAILTELLQGDFPDCDFYGVFTVREETGLRGAAVVGEAAHVELALILDGTTANDMPGASAGEPVTEIGKGPALSFMDGRTITRAPMLEALRATAEKRGIPYQLRRGARGGTDAGALHKAALGCVTGGISLPCRYIHSPVSVASTVDFENMYTLASAFLKDRRFEEVLRNV